MFSVAVSAATAVLLFGVASAHAESAEALATTPSPDPAATSASVEAVPSSAPETAPPPSNSEPALTEPVDAEPAVGAVAEPAVGAVESAAVVETAVVEEVEQVASAANLESPGPIEPEVATDPIRRVTESAKKVGQGTATTARRAVEGMPAIDKNGGGLPRAPFATAANEGPRSGAAPVAAAAPPPSEQPGSRQVNFGADEPRAGEGALPLTGPDLRYLATSGAAFDPSRFTTSDFGDPPMGIAYRYLEPIGDSGSAAGERSRNLAPANGNDLVPPPASPQSAAAGSGGSPSFVPVAALLALLALVAPATYRRLRDGPAFPAPDPFVCALERPG
jgi:hypothetical protein